jgi:hypothetical protein
MKPYMEWLKPNDHIICKFPKKLIGEQSGLTGRIQSSLNKDRGEAVGYCLLFSDRKFGPWQAARANRRNWRIAWKFNLGLRAIEK